MDTSVKLTEQNIEDIVSIFIEVNIWNDGRFIAKVDEYCSNNDINNKVVNAELSIAFENYLMTNIKSENAIRHRLRRLL